MKGHTAPGGHMAMHGHTTIPRSHTTKRLPAATRHRVPRHPGGSRTARRALAGALTATVLVLAAPAVAAPLAPAKPCPTGRYWEPHNKACVPMSPPVHRF